MDFEETFNSRPAVLFFNQSGTVTATRRSALHLRSPSSAEPAVGAARRSMPAQV